MNGNSNGTPICPCGAFQYPAVIFNPAGLSTIAYRVGDYTAFRHALLQALPGESELTENLAGTIVQLWRPSADGDLALQMMEWWAYLADVLTFYNERIANQAYLRTADLPESVNRLIQILGYRPQPGIGATGLLAALLNTTKPFTLPKGFQVQSKPGPGKQPQIFELGADTLVQPPDAVAAQPANPVAPLFTSSGSTIVLWLQGTVGSIKPNDRLLLLANEWPASGGFAWLSVVSVAPQKDATGNAVTKLTTSAILQTLPSGAQVTDYQLLKSGQSARLWGFPTTTASVVGSYETVVFEAEKIAGGVSIQPDLAIAPRPVAGISSYVVLSSVAHQITAGDPVLLDVANNPAATELVTLASSADQIWYANGDGSTPPPQSPPDPQHIAIGIPVTVLTFNGFLSISNAQAPITTVRFGWTTAANLVAVPSPGANQIDPNAGTGTLEMNAVPPALFPAIDNSTLLIQDAAGNGAQASASASADQTSITLGDVSVPSPSVSESGSASLTFPFNLLFNLLAVSRGKTVANEVLGSGNAAAAGQDFTLKNSPVTYLQSSASTSGDNYSSTIKVSVNGVQWSEVRSFYGQPPNAQIFITKEDEQGLTHVVFGDGVNGSRLPSGTNNVVATYRYGSGADAPAAGTLTVVMQPQPGLKSIENPMPVGGGADPDPPGKSRQLAPNSVLTFGRAVSLDDFEVIAASAPGVAKAKAAYSFDPLSQRPRVTVWIAGDSSAQSSAYNAIAAAADPNRLPSILVATPLAMTLQLTLMLNPRYDETAVMSAVEMALLDPDSGLFGANVVEIGQAYYDSQIYAACLAVPGVDAVHGLSFNQAFRFRPRFVILGRTVDQRHDPGSGYFFSVPNDPQHFQISSVTA
jgi:hypothetical protein